MKEKSTTDNKSVKKKPVKKVSTAKKKPAVKNQIVKNPNSDIDNKDKKEVLKIEQVTETVQEQPKPKPTAKKKTAVAKPTKAKAKKEIVQDSLDSVNESFSQLPPMPIPPKKTGRPRIEIDWEQFDALCGMMCTQEEIAAFFDISVDTIEKALKREKKTSFTEYFKKKSATGKRSLRRAQLQLALKGNPTMLIWMGKQHLGQSDKLVQETNTVDNLSKFVEVMDKSVSAAFAAFTPELQKEGGGLNE